MTEPLYHLAQVNIALLKAPIGSELLRDFVAELEPVNSIADAAPGFVWRMQTDEGDATSIRGFGDDRLIVNMSVWESVESLASFVYRNPAHLAVLRKRKKWFQHPTEMHKALWWIPRAHIPTVEEAEERVAFLRSHGPTPIAFTFKQRFSPPVTDPSSTTMTTGSAPRDLGPVNAAVGSALREQSGLGGHLTAARSFAGRPQVRYRGGKSALPSA